MSRYFQVAGWLLCLAIAVTTIGPIGLRPSFAGPSLERFSAFALLGLVFGLGYWRNPWLALALVLGSATLFELLQLMAPGRHGRMFDLGIKLAGGAAGTAAGIVASTLARTISLKTSVGASKPHKD